MPPTDAGPSHATATPERRPPDRPTSIRRTVWLASASMLVLVCVLVALSLSLQAWTGRQHLAIERLYAEQHVSGEASHDRLDAEIAAASLELRRARRTSMIAVAVTAALLAAVATIATRRLYRRIARPLLDLQATVKGIEQGRRDRAGPMRSVEFDTLARSLNRMADRVEEREGHLRAIIESEPECVKTIAPDGRLLDMNPAGLAAVEAASIEAVRGAPVLDLVHPDHRDAYRAMHERVIAGSTESLTFELIGLQGTRRWIETHAVPLRDADGTVQAHLAVSRDVTERRRHEQELHAARDAAEAASRSKSAFLANMSHEIRTPMTAILGFADLLDTPDTTEEQRRECIETIRRNGTHLLAIINDILDLSKIEAGRLQIEQIPVSVHGVIADVLELMTVRAASKALELEVAWRGAIPHTIRTDPVRLRQILVNLVGNAIKFTEAGGIRVEVGITHPETGDPVLTIDVVDSGIGMTDEERRSIFEPFSQGDTSMTRRFGGTGLGLEISRKLAWMLGGGIAAESEPGRGSRFTLTIDAGPLDGVAPIAPEVLAATADAPDPLFDTDDDDEEAAALAGVRILVAEDGLDNQRLIGFILERAGAEVRIVDNGQRAVDALTADGAERFDLILMDMQMPELDGYGAARELREHGCTLPIVALTAHAMSADRARCLAAGCSDYASKPIDRPQLIELCRSWTSGVAA